MTADVEASPGQHVDEKHEVHQVLPSGRSVSPVDLNENRLSISSTSAAQKILAHSHDADEA